MKKPLFTIVPGSIVAAQGFSAAGVFCDIKRLGTGKGSQKGKKRDLAIISSQVPAQVAGLFTTNQACAAPVKVCLERVRKGVAQVIVANSGNANACTAAPGLKDAFSMAHYAARLLRVHKDHVLVASTGRIGLRLPMANIRRGIQEAAAALHTEATASDRAAEAIMTSDTHPKQVAVKFQLDGKPVHLGGIAKGAGMIQPGMSPSGRRPAVKPSPHATMLAFLTTDANVTSEALQSCLNQAVAQSFNRITVDGDMSTNDTVLLLANGLAGNTALRPRARAARGDLEVFQQALDYVCLELAKMMVRDGEGVHRVVTLRITGARSAEEAEQAARAVANSPLVKTSWHGGDPNWGRIVAALGYSPATIAEDQIDIGYSEPGSRRILWSVRKGRPTRTTFAQLCRAVATKEFDLHIRLNQGRGATVLYAADLTEAYVDFNKGDVTNPESLGG